MRAKTRKRVYANNEMIRPAKCLICHERLYYSDDKRYEDEVCVSVTSNHAELHGRYYYAHLKCWKNHIHPPEQDATDKITLENFRKRKI